MSAQSHDPPARTVAQAVQARLEARHVVLQPVRAQDYELLRLFELRAHLVPLWRYQGATPSPDEWAQGMAAGVLAQFVVVRITDQRPLGLVAAYNSDFRHRYAHLAAAKFDAEDRSPLFLEGVALFIDYAFTCWDFRKLYIETSELSLGAFGSGLRWLFSEEGRLRDHRYYAGKYWDQYILALYRDTWDRVAADIKHLLA